jgi:hypothetical protein
MIQNQITFIPILVMNARIENRKLSIQLLYVYFSLHLRTNIQI